jgi:methyl-accepting chemotaxis protein
MSNLTIKAKLFAICGLVIVITLISNWVSWSTGREVDLALSEERALSTQAAQLFELRAATRRLNVAGADVKIDMVKNQGQATAPILKAFLDARAEVVTRFAELRKLATTEEERRLEKLIAGEGLTLTTLFDNLQQAANTRDIPTALSLHSPVYATSEKQRGYINEYIALAADKEAKANARARAALARANTVSGIVDIVIITVVLGSMLFLGRSILVPISQAVTVADAIATGNLRVDIPTGGKDEIGQLLNALRRMRDGLAAITRQINDTSGAVGSSLSQVRATLTSQAAASAQQAAAVNEATATLAEISATSKQTMERTAFLGEIAEKARVESARGQSAVGDAVQGMNAVREKVEAVSVSILDLSKKNQQIGGITDAVDDLARQSKMLALNASIEAARAGEAGHGFAVVAKEITNLAEQSRDSTAQVRAILLDIQRSSERAVLATEEGAKQTAVGNRQVQDAGKVIGSLGDVVQQTAIGSQQITAAVRQEAAGIEQIVTALRDIATATNNAAASTRQAESAMESLARVTGELQERVKVYRL